MALTRPLAAEKQNSPALADVLDEYADAIEAETATTNYDLAKARDIPLVKERSQTVTMDTGHTPIHDMILVNGRLFAGIREAPFYFARFNNLEDLTDRTVVQAPAGSDYTWAESVIYVPEKDRIYVAGSRSSKIVIHEINPETLAITTPINVTETFGQGQSPALASDGTHIYIVTYNTNSKVYKYRLSDYVEVAETTLTGLANGHAMIYDGDSLYAGGGSSPAWIAKINPADLTFTSAAFAGGVNLITHPGLASAGDSVFVGIEGSPGSLWKVNKDTLALAQITGVTSQVAAVHYDGQYVWAAQYGAPGKLSRVDPATGAVATHTFASGEDHAYVMASEGQRLFITFFDPVPNKVKRFEPAGLALLGNDHTENHDGLKQTFRGVRLRKTSDQALTDATFAVVTYTAEDYDTNGFHDNATNTSRITIPTGLGGYYLIWGLTNFKDGSAGRRITDLKVNGAGIHARGEAAVAAASLYASTSFTTVLSLAVGDYIEISAYADGGTGANLDGGNQICWFGATLVGV